MTEQVASSKGLVTLTNAGRRMVFDDWRSQDVPFIAPFDSSELHLKRNQSLVCMSKHLANDSYLQEVRNLINASGVKQATSATAIQFAVVLTWHQFMLGRNAAEARSPITFQLVLFTDSKTSEFFFLFNNYSYVHSEKLTIGYYFGAFLDPRHSSMVRLELFAPQVHLADDDVDDVDQLEESSTSEQFTQLHKFVTKPLVTGNSNMSNTSMFVLCQLTKECNYY